jgi:hypothetical protein
LRGFGSFGKLRSLRRFGGFREDEILKEIERFWGENFEGEEI